MCGWNWPVDSTLVLGIDLTHLWFVVCIGETPFFPGIKNYLVDTWFLSFPELFHCQGRWRDEHQNCQIREEVNFFKHCWASIIAQDEVRPHKVHMQDFFWKYVFQVDAGTAKQWQSGIGCKTYLLKMKTCILHYTAVRLHVYLVFVKSIEQELKIQWEYRSHRNFDFKRPYLGNEKW